MTELELIKIEPENYNFLLSVMVGEWIEMKFRKAYPEKIKELIEND